MGLQDRYKSLTGAAPASPAAAPTSAAPSTAAPTTSTSAAPSAAAPRTTPAASSSSPVAASPATGSPTPARRDLTALRQKLAGGNGGVNPPEAAAAVKDDMLDVTTKETPDGGAEPLPNHPDAAKLGVPSTAAPAAVEAPSGDAPAKRKRRTKAEMEAARAAEAAAVSTAPASAQPAEPSSDESPVALAHGIGTPEFYHELAAADAEAQGHTILTDEVRAQLVADIRQDLLANLSLEQAINLVRERMPRGVKSLEIEA
jgi:hypothetical protein